MNDAALQVVINCYYCQDDAMAKASLHNIFKAELAQAFPWMDRFPRSERVTIE